MSLTGGPVSATVGTPITNAGLFYVNGLNMTWVSTTTFTISNGAARDSQNITDIVFPPTLVTTNTPYTTTPSTITINTAVQGAGGIDTGTIAATKLYYVYIIGDSLGNNNTTAVISLNSTTPLIPFGYDSYRRIGCVATDGGALVLNFLQIPLGSGGRVMWYDVRSQVLTAGTQTAYTEVSLANLVPITTNGMNIIVTAEMTPTAAGDIATFVPFSSTSTNGYVQLSGVVAAQPQYAQLIIPATYDATNGYMAFKYKVTNGADSLNVFLNGYKDYI